MTATTFQTNNTPPTVNQEGDIRPSIDLKKLEEVCAFNKEKIAAALDRALTALENSDFPEDSPEKKDLFNTTHLLTQRYAALIREQTAFKRVVG